jgi:long-chain fatty acid transport protein
MSTWLSAPLPSSARPWRLTKLLRLASAALPLAGALALPHTALASPLLELVGDVHGRGGLNARATEGGAASAYFNPAFLTLARPGLEVGVFVLNDRIAIDVDDRPGTSADLPVGVASATSPKGESLTSYGLATSWLDSGHLDLPARPRQGNGSSENVRGYLVLGYVAQWFDGRLGLGVYTMIPSGQYTGASAFFVDEREQYFTNSLHAELYSDRLTATSLAFGVGVRLTERLSIGAAVTLGLAATAKTPTFLNDISRFEDLQIGADFGVDVALAPHAGITYQLTEQARVAATLHTPQKFEVTTDFTFLVANGIYQGAKIGFVHHYLPLQIGLGGSYEAYRSGDASLLFVGNALYARWSDYQDRHAERPLEPYGWYDTVTPSLGARYRAGRFSTLVDAVYQPTPVPEQTGRTNYVDNTRIGVTTGAEYTWPVGEGALAAGFRAQAHALPQRSTRKLQRSTPLGTNNRTSDFVIDEVPDDSVVGGAPFAGRDGLQTNNPGWPGFTSSGWLLGGSLYVSYKY